MTTVFNKITTDLTKQPMFFGEPQNIARYDIERYPIFGKLTDTMKSFYWNPEEINLQKDAADFKSLAEHEKHIFVMNISYQVLLDSVQERAPLTALLPWISLPELEATVIWWSAFEQIHSQSYQWILQNIFPEPASVFDKITENTDIMKRAEAIIRYYDDFIKYSEAFRTLGEGKHTITSPSLEYEVTLTKRELKRKLYLALHAVFALEAIRFYVSFACSFAFGQQGKLKGNASIIKLIAKDEAQHLAVTTNIIRNLTRKENDPEWIEIAAAEEANVLAIFDEVVDQERDWVKYLFKEGAIIGLNEALLIQYLEHIANKRLKVLGYKQRYEHTTNPFGWLGAWLGAEDHQTAPQEAEVTEYLINVLDTSVDESKLIEI